MKLNYSYQNISVVIYSLPEGSEGGSDWSGLIPVRAGETI